jgi:hypothetical protein
MAQTAIENLFFSIGLIDKVTGPAAGMNKAITQMYENFTTGLNQVMDGGAGIFGVTQNILSLTSATRDFNNAYGEADSQENFASELGVLGKASQKLAMHFGDDAGKMLKFAYDMQFAIPEMTKGTPNAIKEIDSITEPFERLVSVGKVFDITFGKTILSGVDLVIGSLSNLGSALIQTIDVFSPLRWAIATVSTGIEAFSAGWEIMERAVEAYDLWTKLAAKIRIAKVVLWKLNVISGTMTKTQKIAAIATWLWHSSINKVVGAAKFLRLNLIWNKTVTIASAIWTKVLAIAQGAMALGFWGSCAAVWSFTAALLACPITWIVIGVMVLVGAIIGLIYYWDEVCDFVVKYADHLLMLLGPIGWVISAFRNWDKIVAWLSGVWNAFKKVCPNIANLLEKLFANWWRGLKVIFSFWKSIWDGIVNFFVNSWNSIIDAIASVFNWIIDLGSGIWNGFISGVETVYNWLSNLLLPIIQSIGQYFEWLGSLGSTVWGGIKSVFSNIDGWIGKILKTLSKIPGLGFLNPDVNVNKTTEVEQSVVPSVAAARKIDVPAGGIRNSNTKVNNYGGVTINTSNPIGPGELEDMLALQV